MSKSKITSNIKGVEKLFINRPDPKCAPIISCTLKPELERLATEEWFRNICRKNYMLVMSIGTLFARMRIFDYNPDRYHFSRKVIRKRYRKIMSDIYNYIVENDIEIDIDIKGNSVKRFFRSIWNFISDLGYSNVWGKSSR